MKSAPKHRAAAIHATERVRLRAALMRPIPVEAPFGHIAVHVVQTPGIRRFLRHAPRARATCRKFLSRVNEADDLSLLEFLSGLAGIAPVVLLRRRSLLKAILQQRYYLSNRRYDVGENRRGTKRAEDNPCDCRSEGTREETAGRMRRRRSEQPLRWRQGEAQSNLRRLCLPLRKLLDHRLAHAQPAAVGNGDPFAGSVTLGSPIPLLSVARFTR